MYKSKRFAYEYEEYEDGDKGPNTLVEDIMKDEEFDSLEEIVIGCWGEAWEDSPQPLIDGIVANAGSFSHIKSLFIGDMDFEDCEVSWIIQGDYSKLWDAMPQLESITIKGSTDLTLGLKSHNKLQSLEIICGGLPKEIIKEVQEAVLPSLKKLLLYIGVEDYGFDGDIQTIRDLLAESDFSGLTYLGITDSEIQDEITRAVLDSKYISQISTLDLSYGSLTDKGGAMLLEELPNYSGVKKLNLEYHFLSDDMVKKLSAMCEKEAIEVNLEDQQEADDYDGELYYWPMLTE